MSTTTTRAALVKPATTEFYDVTVFNANADKIYNLLGFTPVTSTTRPSTPITGQGALESDTGAAIVSNGSSPASASWSYLHGTAGFTTVGAVGTAAALRIQTTSTLSGNRVFDFRKSGDTNAAHIMDFDGRMQWGPGGSGGPDVNLYRSGVGVLATDNTFTVGGLPVTCVAGGRRYVSGSTLATTSGTTEILTGVDTGTLSLDANSSYLITIQLNMNQSAASDTYNFIVRDTNISGTVRYQAVTPPNGAAGIPLVVKISFIWKTTTATSIKWVVSMQRISGSGTASITASSNGSTYAIATKYGPSANITDV